MNAVQVLQIIVAILLIGAIALQNQGSGLGPAWGGGGESYHTRRGLERVVFVSTIVLAVLFTILSLIALV
jgi:protein translocase SecG subunit